MDDRVPGIPFSTEDMERQRLETTLDQDMSSLSLFNSNTAASSSFSSISTIGVGRSAAVHPAVAQAHAFDHDEYPRFPHSIADDTPRAGRHGQSFARTESTGVGYSPASTAGHHVSAATLGAGVFKRPSGPVRPDRTGDDFDPDRSLGNLVTELQRAMDDERFPAKPASPFVSPRSQHSPSPASSALPNLSLTLSRNDPLPSPPASRTVSSASSNSHQRVGSDGNSRLPSRSTRPALGETSRHNNQYQPPPASTHKKRTKANDTLDITGLTALLATPAKGRQYEDLDKNGGGDTAGSTIPQTLATLHARLRALETENSVSRRRVRELEGEVERAKEEVERAQRGRDSTLREVIGEKSVLEELVARLRAELARVTLELEQNKALVAELRAASKGPPSPVRPNRSVHDDISSLRREVERLGREVSRLNAFAEQGLLQRTRAREERSMRVSSDEEAAPERTRKEGRSVRITEDALPSQLRQGIHAAAAVNATLLPPSAKPRTRVAYVESETDGETSPTPASRTASRTSRHSNSPRLPFSPVAGGNLSPLPSPAHSGTSTRSEKSRRRRRAIAEGPDSPFPSIRPEDEQEFFSPAPARRLRSPLAPPREPTRVREAPRTDAPLDSVRTILRNGGVPPQTVLARIIRELEDDFSHYKAIYVELADQYKVLDAASAVTKRHVLAEHLKEVIDSLEQKADQIAALYSLLDVNDRPAAPVEKRPQPKKSVNDLWRAVRDALGDDAARRLEADGLFRTGRRTVSA